MRTPARFPRRAPHPPYAFLGICSGIQATEDVRWRAQAPAGYGSIPPCTPPPPSVRNTIRPVWPRPSLECQEVEHANRADKALTLPAGSLPVREQ